MDPRLLALARTPQEPKDPLFPTTLRLRASTRGYLLRRSARLGQSLSSILRPAIEKAVAEMLDQDIQAGDLTGVPTEKLEETLEARWSDAAPVG